MELLVTVQIAGEDVPAGRLFQNVRNGAETASFSYSEAYLAHPGAFALSPDMPLSRGSFHSEGLRDLRAFEDCMPDRWGRNLLMRAERNEALRERRAARSLFECDMLAGVGDETRQGAVRIWGPDGLRALAPSNQGVPREVSVLQLLEEADLAATDMDADVRDLVAAGSSLGGARPKASVRGERGALCIAKFPKVDESAIDDVCAWERVSLQLMERAGIVVPASRLLRVSGRSVLLLERFDRIDDTRVPYLSGLSAIQGDDGGRYSYLDLVEFLEEEGAAPDDDIPELWKRALFTCAIGNTDNHMRNQGLLRDVNGWRLSPAFDVNPSKGDQSKYLASAVGFDDARADPSTCLEVCEYYRVSARAAKRVARDMALVLSDWQKAASSNGISKASIDAMASCFESGIDRLRTL